jgi:hypothetical protein
LRYSFASLLIHEGVLVVEVVRQMGNAPDVTLGTYAHVFEELDPAERVSAAEAIRSAREEFDVREEYAEGEGLRRVRRRIPPHQWKPTLGLEPRTPSLRVMCSTS